MTDVDFVDFVRKPFVVEAVQITKENIEALAPMIGTLRYEKGEPYIQVDRHKVPSVFKVHPGYWFTRMGDKHRCYSRRIFREQFTTMTPQLEAIVLWHNAPEPNQGET